MYETYNFLVNYLKTNQNIKNLRELKKILICFLLLFLTLLSECLSELGFREL